MPEIALHAQLPRDASGPARARTLLHDAFDGRLEAERLDAALIAASELVANAVLHGEGAIRLHATLEGERFRAEVVDDGGGFEHELRERGEADFDGRGLLIVSRLADRWGVHEGTTHVWFELGPEADAPAAELPRLGADERPPGLDGG